MEISKNKIKYIHSLYQKKYRDQHGLFIVEGEKMVNEALENHSDSIVELYYTEDFSSLFNLDRFQLVTENDLKKITLLKTVPKVFAIIKQFQAPLPQNIHGLTIVLDSIQDPGNMGTILRIADWFGIQNIICSDQTVDVYNPKVVQSSMGALFRIKINYTDIESFLKKVKVPVYGALLNGENIYQKKNFNQNAILLMGNEGKGISQNLLPYISQSITIPKFGMAESLNVAVACGIIVSEIKRNSI